MWTATYGRFLEADSPRKEANVCFETMCLKLFYCTVVPEGRALECVLLLPWLSMTYRCPRRASPCPPRNPLPPAPPTPLGDFFYTNSLFSWCGSSGQPLRIQYAVSLLIFRMVK